MVKIIDAEETLKRMCYDIPVMISNNTDPKVVLNTIRKRINYLETDKSYYRVHWWNSKPRRIHNHNKKDVVKDLFEEDLLIDGVTKY